MVFSRVFSRSHLLLRAGASCIRVTPSAIPSFNQSLSRRAFTSSVSAWEEIVQTPSRGPEIALTDNRAAPTGDLANSIALLRLPKRASRSEIEELLRSKGFNIKRLQLRVNRFTFQNDNMCFVELGSPEEAQRAVKELDKSSLMNSSIVVSTPLKEGFRWGLIEKPTKHPYESRFFLNEGNNAEEALKPLAEGRRMALSVQTPGWSPGAKIGEATENALKIIEQNFAKYGVESISNISVFYGDKKTNPRLLCFIDFKTKEGTEQAAKDKHDTEINSRLVWLKPSIPAGWRVHQFWKSAPRVVEQLQEKGVLTKEMDADKFNNPLPKRQKKKKSQ